MTNIFSYFRWGWLLTIALFIPISLPAGGAQKKLSELYYSHSSANLIAGSLCEFRSFPSNSSKVRRKVSLGTSMQVLRRWESPNGITWFHVQIKSFPFLENTLQMQRGWIKI